MVEYLTVDTNSSVTIKEFRKGESLKFNTNKNQLYYISRGGVSISYNQFSKLIVNEGELVLVPVSVMLSITPNMDTRLVVYEFSCVVDPWINIRLDRLAKVVDMNNLFYNKIIANKAIKLYFDSLMYYDKDLKNIDFFKLKERELFYILFAYYSNVELYSLFKPLIGKDYSFKSLVLSNHLGVRGVSELASISGYSLSTFKRRFYENFGESVYTWMQKQKSKQIINHFKNEKVVFSEIISMYGFSSASHFTRFCKKYYGVTPSELRERITDEVFWESLCTNNF